MSIQFAYVTTGSREEAEMIAEAVVTEKLAACANIVPGIRSVFEWNGKLCREEETVVVLKTVAEKKEELTARICKLHSCDCPCVVFLPIEGGNPGFLRWVAESVRGAGSAS
jgi:periplasmic divalent cation tolerance protein